MKRIAVVAALLLAAAACSAPEASTPPTTPAPASQPSKVKFTGRVEYSDYVAADWKVGDECRGKKANELKGQPVVITDDGGKTIGTTTLATGAWVASVPEQGSQLGKCKVEFKDVELPDSPFYGVKVGTLPVVTLKRSDVVPGPVVLRPV